MTRLRASLLCMMLRLRVTCFLLPLIFASFVNAQSDPQALEQALAGKQFVLRSYSADPVARYAWKDGGVVPDAVQLHSFGIFTPKSVKLKGSKITIQGERGTLLNDNKNNTVGLGGKAPMALEINLGGTDPAVALPRLQEALFFADVPAGKDALPPQLKEMVPFNLAVRTPAACRCQQYFDEGKWNETPTADHKITQPRVLNLATPEMPRDAKGSGGRVTIMLFVTPAGVPGDLWLMRPAGPGYDESAAEAARKYRFAPAQYEGHAVGVELSIDVNFQG